LRRKENICTSDSTSISILCKIFTARLIADHIPHSDINWVIMDYLVSEGYPGAAEKFAQETNIGSPTDLTSIRERVKIRNAIHAGKVDVAIELINDIDPEVCTSFSTSPLPPSK
jgi:hypothetical protein